MAYQLERVTVRTDNTPEGIEKMKELWHDVVSGKLPLLFDSEHNFRKDRSPVGEYSNYEAGESGAYDLSIVAVTPDFYQHLEQEVQQGRYRKYEEHDENNDIDAAIWRAWKRVWEDQENGTLPRAFLRDYEDAVPAEYTKDGKAYICLYISVK